MAREACRLAHLGGETCVMGSCHLVQAGGLNILVDCGAVQGNDRAVAMDDWPVVPAEIHYVLVTDPALRRKVPELDRLRRIPVVVDSPL